MYFGKKDPESLSRLPCNSLRWLQKNISGIYWLLLVFELIPNDEIKHV